MGPFPITRTTSPRQKPADETLTFGKVTTDHMFLMNYEEGKGWFNPRIEPYGPLSLDPATSVLHYGQAIFDGLKAFRGDDGQIRLFRARPPCAALQPVRQADVHAGTAGRHHPRKLRRAGRPGCRLGAAQGGHLAVSAPDHHRDGCDARRASGAQPAVLPDPLAGRLLLQGRREAGAHPGHRQACPRGEGRHRRGQDGGQLRAVAGGPAATPRRPATPRCCTSMACTGSTSTRSAP